MPDSKLVMFGRRSRPRAGRPGWLDSYMLRGLARLLGWAEPLRR